MLHRHGPHPPPARHLPPQAGEELTPIEVAWVERPEGHYYFAFGGCHRWAAHTEVGHGGCSVTGGQRGAPAMLMSAQGHVPAVPAWAVCTHTALSKAAEGADRLARLCYNCQHGSPLRRCCAPYAALQHLYCTSAVPLGPHSGTLAQLVLTFPPHARCVAYLC